MGGSDRIESLRSFLRDALLHPIPLLPVLNAHRGVHVLRERGVADQWSETIGFASTFKKYQRVGIVNGKFQAYLFILVWIHKCAQAHTCTRTHAGAHTRTQTHARTHNKRRLWGL